MKNKISEIKKIVHKALANYTEEIQKLSQQKKDILLEATHHLEERKIVQLKKDIYGKK